MFLSFLEASEGQKTARKDQGSSGEAQGSKSSLPSSSKDGRPKISNFWSYLGLIEADLGVMEEDLGVMEDNLGMMEDNLAAMEDDLGREKCVQISNSLLV